MVPSLLCTFVAHITFLHVFFLPPPFILSLSLLLSLSLSLSFSLSLFISAPSFSLWLQDTCHLMPFTKYSLLDQSYFFTPYLSIAHIKFTNYSPTIFYDYHPQSCLKNIFFRSRANRRLVCLQSNLRTVWVKHGVETDLQNWWLLVFKHPMGADNCLRIGVTLKVNWLKIGFEDGEVAKQYRTMGLVGQLVFTS